MEHTSIDKNSTPKLHKTLSARQTNEKRDEQILIYHNASYTDRQVYKNVFLIVHLTLNFDLRPQCKP